MEQIKKVKKKYRISRQKYEEAHEYNNYTNDNDREV